MPSGFRVWNTSSKRTMLEGEGSRETAWKAAWSDVRFIPLAHVFRSFIIWLGNSAELVLNTSHRSGTEILLSLGWGQTSQKSLDSSYLFHFCSPVFVSVVVFSPQSHNWSDHSFVGFFRGACLLTLALLWFISEWGGWGYLLAASSLHVPFVLPEVLQADILHNSTPALFKLFNADIPFMMNRVFQSVWWIV